MSAAGGEARSRAGLVVAGVGGAHALLFLASYWLLTSTPGARAPDAEIVAFYESGRQSRLVLVGLYVMPFAGITFLWFCTALRAWTRCDALPRGELLSGIQLVSGILYIALFFGAAAAFSVMAVSTRYTHAPVDPVVARQFPLYGAALFMVFAMRMAAMFVFTTSCLLRRTGALPRWFAYLGFVVSLFLLGSASFRRALVLVFPLWLLLACTLFLLRPRATPAAITAPGS
jgi:hypothetical protein